jgi:CII-binding regulator of phage lambda lysogenization HflD
MANGKTPETEGEHIVAIYGHIEGLKKGHDVFDQNLNRVEGKLDKFENYLIELHKKLDERFITTTWWVVGGLATLIATIIGILSFQ